MVVAEFAMPLARSTAAAPAVATGEIVVVKVVVITVVGVECSSAGAAMVGVPVTAVPPVSAARKLILVHPAAETAGKTGSDPVIAIARAVHDTVLCPELMIPAEKVDCVLVGHFVVVEIWTWFLLH